MNDLELPWQIEFKLVRKATRETVILACVCAGFTYLALSIAFHTVFAGVGAVAEIPSSLIEIAWPFALILFVVLTIGRYSKLRRQALRDLRGI